ncbi:MAG: L-histidine N(alpha)-methyltransferase [Chloroflexota bacterium]|nr:L-histidine N(alpha)-methyltransferase [Chloroflexota bacterium]
MAGFTVDVHLDGRGVLDTIGEDVRRGLSAPRKFLYPKYFYDAHGSQLFEQITELPEYYPTRTELAILCAERENILRRAAPHEMLELGSGASTKVRTLLDGRPDPATPARYVAFDVSESIVREAGEDLVRSYPGLEVHGVIGDFERHLGTIPPAEGRRLVLFLGGTIGNLEHKERRVFLCKVRDLLSPGDFLLLGVDLVKDMDVLEAAYNDSAGVSTDFSRNVLSVINHALHADFDLSLWRHRAHWNANAARIEMHLYARSAHSIRIVDLDMTVDFAEGESIWTESSHKFTRETASAMLEAAGMTLDTWYTDDREYFGLVLARAT